MSIGDRPLLAARRWSPLMRLASDWLSTAGPLLLAPMTVRLILTACYGRRLQAAQCRPPAGRLILASHDRRQVADLLLVAPPPY